MTEISTDRSLKNDVVSKIQESIPMIHTYFEHFLKNAQGCKVFYNDQGQCL